MKFLVLQFLISFSLNLSAQSFGSVYIGMDEDYVLRDMNKEIRKGVVKKTIKETTKNKINDTLIYTVANNAECFTTKMTFHYLDPDLEENYCDYQEYVFDCGDCAKKHLQDMIAVHKFRKKSENVYLSEYFYNSEMTVIEKPESADRITLVIKRVGLSKLDYNKIYKNLPDKSGK